MPDLAWNIPLGDNNFQIIYQHRLCKPNKVWVNGNLVNQTPFRVLKDFYFCWEDFGHNFEIIALPTFGFSQCFLRVDNVIVDSDGKPKKKFSKSMKYFLQEEIAWKQLAGDLGCVYLPLLSETGVYINQIVGNVSEHFVYLKFGIVPFRKANVPGIFILIKHGSFAELSRKRLTSLIREYPSKTRLLKNAVIDCETNYTLLMIPLLGKISIIDHQAELLEILRLLLSYLPNTQSKCESENHSGLQTDALNVVLINGFPNLMCDECIRTYTPPIIENEIFKKDLESPRPWGKAIIILLLINILLPLSLMPFFSHIQQFVLLIGVYDILLNFFILRKIGFKESPLLVNYLFSGILSFLIYFWGYGWNIYGSFQNILTLEHIRELIHIVSISRHFRILFLIITSLMLLFLVQKLLTVFILKQQLKKLINHPTIEVIYSGFFNNSETRN